MIQDPKSRHAGLAARTRPRRETIWSLLFCAVVIICPAATARSQETTKAIIVVPPIQWNSTMTSYSSAYKQTIADFSLITGGIIFGMAPADVNGLLPSPLQGFSWSSLPLAPEFPEDVKYFWTRLRGAQVLSAEVTSCFGEDSYIAFLFRYRGLVRISYRLLPDEKCTSTLAAAQEVLSYYARINTSVALSMHYRNGPAEVVDIADPTVNYLIPIRWTQRRR